MLQAALQDQEAEAMQAVDTMLELVPKGVNKWIGIQALLQSLQIPVEVRQVMSVSLGRDSTGNAFSVLQS